MGGVDRRMMVSSVLRLAHGNATKEERKTAILPEEMDASFSRSSKGTPWLCTYMAKRSEDNSTSIPPPPPRGEEKAVALDDPRKVLL